jgi:Domain of unknown function (DUF4260)
MAIAIQRTENAAIGLAIVVAMIASAQPWWLLLIAFLAFDVSAAGYLAGPRVGAVAYNMVHNYTGSAILIAIYAAALPIGHTLTWIALLAACWGFHVAIDRALGYGLKLQTFTETHLGPIGRRLQARLDDGVRLEH